MYRKGIDLWNQMHPIHTAVEVGKRTATLTQSSAFTSSKGSSMVWLVGFPFPVKLTRVKALHGH